MLPVYEFLFILGIWAPESPSHYKAAKAFVEVNRRYWGPVKTRGKSILVEGHLSEYGPNYLFRTGLAAKAIQSAIGSGNITVITNGYSHQWQTAILCYRSFLIKKWIFLGNELHVYNLYYFVIAAFRGAISFFALNSPADILQLSHGRIKVGDLIYDSVLKSAQAPTINKLSFAVYFGILRSWYYYYRYSYIFSRFKYDYYVASHTAYSEYGLLCRVALASGAEVLETSDIQMSHYTGISSENLPTYHFGISRVIKRELEIGGKFSKHREDRAREELIRRVSSEVKQIDASKAYSGRVYTRDELLLELNIPPATKMGFILAHVFADSPHLAPSLLYPDYYQWLVSTIEFCRRSSDVNWIVKPHPSSSLYNENGIVESLLEKSQSNNIFLCPSDLNTRSLITCADFVVTAHGTAGLEFSCFGIPVVLAGSPFYSGFGFTIDPKTVDEYTDIILNASKIHPLNPVQISMALNIFGLWEGLFDWHNPIISSSVLSNVWGSGVKRNLELAYNELTGNLEKVNPDKLKLWSFAHQVVLDKN